MNGIYKIIMLFLLVSHCNGVLPSQSLHSSPSKRNITPVLIISSFFLGYFIRYISLKKTDSRGIQKDCLTLSTQIPTESSESTITVDSRIQQIQQTLEKKETENKQMIQANKDLKKTNELLTTKINTLKECVYKLFPSTLEKGSFATVRFKTNTINTTTVEDSKNSVEPIIIEMLEAFELNQQFKPIYNNHTKSWLLEKM